MQLPPLFKKKRLFSINKEARGILYSIDPYVLKHCQLICSEKVRRSGRTKGGEAKDGRRQDDRRPIQDTKEEKEKDALHQQYPDAPHRRLNQAIMYQR